MQEAGEWLSTEEAARYWTEIAGGFPNPVISVAVSAQKFRKLCREGDLAAAGIEVLTTPRGYLISRSDLLHAVHCQCDAVCGAIDAEELKAWPGKKVRAADEPRLGRAGSAAPGGLPPL